MWVFFNVFLLPTLFCNVKINLSRDFLSLFRRFSHLRYYYFIYLNLLAFILKFNLKLYKIVVII